MKQKNEVRKYEKELRENSISLIKFLVNYCGISETSLDNSKITHKDIKQLIPNLKRVGFDWLMDNRILVDVGKILPVVDITGNIVPYIRPSMENENFIDVTSTKEEKYQKAIEDLVIDEDLKPYQISLLCNKYKVARRFREYKILNRLLKNKLREQNKGVKEYKIKKYELMVKESDENEY